MSVTMDHSSLNWVKDEIDETLKQARIALEEFVENTEDEAQIRFCVAHLHQVYGTLQMVELYGASLVAEEMENVASALMEKSIPYKNETFEVLMRAILQLPDYLERLQAGQKDMPMVLLPLLNDLRASRGEKLLTEGALFSPDLSVAPSALVEGESEDKDITLVAKKNRHPYQLGLLGWFRNVDEETNLNKLSGVVQTLRNSASLESVARLFWVADGVIDALIRKGIEASISSKLLLGQVDRKIKSLIDGGESALIESGVDDLLKNLLYYVASAPLEDGTVGDIKKAFNLAGALPSQNEINAARESLSGVNLDVIDTVHTALADDLAHIKDELDIFVRAEERVPERLQPLADNLKRVSDTLAMVGLGAQRNRIIEQIDVLNSMIESGNVEDELLMDIAGTLIATENGLREMKGSITPSTAGETDENQMPSAEFHEVLSATIREAKVDLARVKEAIVGFVGAPWEFSQLKDVPELNHQIEGSLTMLSMPQVAKLLNACNEYIQTELLQKEHIPDPDTLNALADCISSIEYYLEAVEENRQDSAAILDIAINSLAKLGYDSEGQNLAAEAQTEAVIPEPEVTAEVAEEAAEVTEAAEPETAEQATETAAEPEVEEPKVVAMPPQTPAQTVTVAPEPAEEIDDEIREIFFEEVEEVMDTLKEYTGKWQSNPDDKDSLTTVRRSFHTLKGSGRMVGALQVGEFGWAIENMLNRVIDGTIESSPEIMDIINKSLKAIPQLMENFRSGQMPEMDVQALADAANDLSKRGESPVLELGAPQPVVEEEQIEEISIEPVAEEVEEIDISPVDEGIEEPAINLDELLAPTAGIEVEEVEESPEAQAEAPFIDPVLLDIFTKESKGHIDDVNNFLRGAESAKEPRITEALIRALHTLHGSAHMAGITDIAEVCDLLEKYTKLLHENDLPIGQDAMGLLRQSIDKVADYIPLINEPESGLQDKQQLVDGIRSIHEALELEIERSEQEVEEETPLEIPVASEAVAEPGEEYDEELLDIFLEEGEEILNASEVTLQNWINDQDNEELVKQLQRELHTLKGGARMAKIASIGDLSHSLESMIIAVVDGKVAVSSYLFDLMQNSHDTLTHMLESVRKGQPVNTEAELINSIDRLVETKGEVPEEIEAVEEEVMVVSGEKRLEEALAAEEEATAEEAQVLEFPEVEPESAEQAFVDRRAKGRIQHEQVKVRADMLDNMVNNAGEVTIYRSRIEQQVGIQRFNLEEMDQTVHRLREQLRQFEIETEAQIMYRFETTGASQYDEEFDPLEMDRFSTMQQLSRAVVESLGDLVSIHGLLESHSREMETLLLQQSRVSTDLQEELMRSRMVPLSTQMPRLRRLVRQTANELKKKIRFVVSGEQGELDRTVMERMLPPLEHMLRNAIDHGIESASARKKAGKPDEATVALTLSREGSEMVMQLSDDGAGINLDALRKKAQERGLIKKDSDITDNEVMRFILESGFSTAKKVTQISGRGVGMDVVNSEIKQLGGSLSIASEQGKGTMFTVRLPLTLSVNKALLVHVGEENYAIPLASVEAVVRAGRDELQSYFDTNNAVYKYAGRGYRFMHLGTVLGVSKPVMPETNKKAPVLLVRAGDHRMALHVDGLMGSREVVVKSVGPQISTVRGISGATILGDGSVALILDISAVVLMDVATAGEAAAEEKPEKAKDVITVMVVDDSITVRRVTTRLLERHNIRAITAKDGVDALTQLQEHTPDLFLLDIEMPRMDGYELAQHIRNSETLKDIPIIMITSRTGEKHRQRAIDIGVNRYLGKPYQEGELLENIQSLLEKPH